MDDIYSLDDILSLEPRVDEGYELGEEDDEDDEGSQMTQPNRPWGPGALEETWWLLGDERTDMADIYERAPESLDKMFERYKIYPIKINEKRKLFFARFEFPRYQQNLMHADAKLKNVEMPLGFIDFLVGFPMQAPELILMLGEWSSREDELTVAHEDYGYPLPAIPDSFFEGYEKEKMLLNLFYLDEAHALSMADDLTGEPKPEGLHWWVRVNSKHDHYYPMPGEFFCLAYRQWVTLPQGGQESNPVIFAGNWMDTIFYSGCRIKAIDTKSKDYPIYTVEWRGYTVKKESTVKPTDFAEYKIGDRVTILKNVPSKKQSQQWKDEDMKEFDGENWMIAPLIFYGIKGLATE
jgi:hypothetical protein